MLGLRIRHLSIALLLMMLWLYAPALAPIAAQEEMKQAENLDHPFDPTVKGYMDKGKYERAIDYLYNDAEEDAYKGTLNADPTDERGWYTLCHIYNLMGEHDKAVEMVELARKNGVDSPRMKLVHGEALYARGDVEAARRIFEPLYKANPGMHKAIYDMAKLHYEAGELEQADALYNSLAGINTRNYPNNSETLYCAAQGLLHRKKYSLAVNLFAAVCSIDPGFEDAWYARASMFLNMFNPPKAFEIVEAYLQFNWRSPLGNLLKAQCMHSSGYQKDRMGNTEIALQAALKYGSKKQEVLSYAIFFYSFWERYDQAQKYVDMALKLNPNSIPMLSQIGFYYYISGQEEKFEALEARVKKLTPRCAEFYYAIGGVMDKKYGYKFSVEYCRKALEANPDFTQAYATLGRNLMFTGFEKEGEKYLRMSRDDIGGFDPTVKNILIVVDHVNKNFVETETEHFIIKMERKDYGLYAPYVEYLLEDAWVYLSAKYKHTPEGKVVVLIFNDPNQFAVRTIGVPGLGQAMGVSFGTALNFKSSKAMYHPKLRRHLMPWAQVAYHEFTHIITLQQSESRTSRWFTEALSEMEQRLKSLAWGREETQIGDVRFVRKLRAGNLISCVDLDQAFVSQYVMDAYYQARVMGDWIRETWGYDKIIEIDKTYAARCTTAEMIETCFKMTPEAFDKAFVDWATRKYEKFQVGPAYIPENIDELKDKIDKKENYYNAQLRADLALAYLQNGKPEEAVEYAEKAAKLDPNNADVYLVRGLLAAMARDKNKAVALLKKADELGSSSKFTIYSTLAQMLQPKIPMANQNMEYLDYMKKAYAVFPSNEQLVLQLATIYERTGDNDAARAMQEQYLKLNDTNIAYRKKMIEIYAKEGKPDRVAQMYREINWIDPFLDDTHAPAAEAFIAVGAFREAGVEYEVIAARQDNRAPMMLKAAECYIKADRLEKAQKCANTALGADPKNPDAAKALLAEIEKLIAERKNAPAAPAETPRSDADAD